MRPIFFAIALLIFTASANAAGPAPAATQPPPTGQQQTRIETDQKTGAIRFIVNGREEARIDATGLHVRQGVEYGGDLTDTGEAYYDKPAKPEPKH